MQTRSLSTGGIGVDLDTVLTSPQCEMLFRGGVQFVIRYLGDLTQQEAETIVGSGLELMAVTHPRSIVDVAYGQLDGDHSVQRAQWAGLPVGIHLWLDLEGWTGDAIGYVNAWAARVQAAGFLAGLYVGATSDPLTPEQLRDLRVTAYWRSCSRVPEPEGVGFMMSQLRPGDLSRMGLLVDLDVVEHDYLGRTPVAAVA